ncbi:MAG: dienelactone hydrolase family protein [Nitrososphaera sp.]
MSGRDFSLKGITLLSAVLASILAFMPVGLTDILTRVLAQDDVPSQSRGDSIGPIFAVGTIANVQRDDDGNPTWILSGSWKMRVDIADADDTSGVFKASILMVSAEGTSMHMHTISDFELSGWSVDNKTNTFNGTAVITLRDGPEKVPLSITIRNGGLISILVDTSFVDHFGSAPIYGTVLRMFDSTGALWIRGQLLHDEIHGKKPMDATAAYLEGLHRSSVSYYPNATGYLVYPESGTALPSVVMIHEWWGLNQNIKNEAEKLAKEGYVVLAVDLFNGQVATDPGRARELVTPIATNPDGAIENLQGAVEYLSALPNVNASRIASLGWCFGGGMSLQLALNAEMPLAATVIYYGSLVTDSQALSSISWPILGIFGSEDQSIPVETVSQFESALNATNIPNEIYVYEGVGHAFANPSGDNYAAAEAADAWQKTLDFLEEHV